jgi:hypothetical protein
VLATPDEIAGMLYPPARSAFWRAETSAPVEPTVRLTLNVAAAAIEAKAKAAMPEARRTFENFIVIFIINAPSSV